MKREKILTICLLALSLSLCAERAAGQHYLGVRGGLGGGTARFDPIREMRFIFGEPSFGVSWKYYSPTRIVGGIEVDLQYVNKGYKMLTLGPTPEKGEQPNYTDTTTYIRRIQAIELPLLWQPHFYVMNRHARLFLNIGMYASYYLSEHESQETNKAGVDVFDRPYEMISVRDNRIDFGLVGGVGVGYFFGRFEVLAEARYSFGYSDLMKPRSKYPYPVNPLKVDRSPIDMINVSFGLNYRLGRGGILAPPSARKLRMTNQE